MRVVTFSFGRCSLTYMADQEVITHPHLGNTMLQAGNNMSHDDKSGCSA